MEDTPSLFTIHLPYLRIGAQFCSNVLNIIPTTGNNINNPLWNTGLQYMIMHTFLSFTWRLIIIFKYLYYEQIYKLTSVHWHQTNPK